MRAAPRRDVRALVDDLAVGEERRPDARAERDGRAAGVSGSGAVQPFAEQERFGVVEETDRRRTRTDALAQRGAEVGTTQVVELADVLEQRDAAGIVERAWHGHASAGPRLRR